jgi:hypothetical protein
MTRLTAASSALHRKYKDRANTFLQLIRVESARFIGPQEIQLQMDVGRSTLLVK